MSNSKLIDYTQLSPNCNKPRNHKIDTITIHHLAGIMSVESCGNMFANPAREASSNYAIGSDGRIALYVDEANRAWTSSSPENDNRAVTIEVSNDGGAPDWHVSDKVLARLIDLCVDICQRNGIAKLNFTGDKSGNLTMHKWFAATLCPGPYLESKFPYIAAEVNKRLASPAATKAQYHIQFGNYESQAEAQKVLSLFKEIASGTVIQEEITKTAAPKEPVKEEVKQITVGSTVKVKQGALTYDGKTLASFVYTRNHTVKEINGDRAVITYNGVVVAAIKTSNLILI